MAGLALLVNAAVWGMSWIPFKYLQSGGMHPLWATCLIFSLSSLVMAVINRGFWGHLRQYPGLLGLMLLAGATNACFNTAVALGDVIRVVLLFYMMPVWAALLARLVLKEPITPVAVAEIALGVSGAALVVFRPLPGVQGLQMVLQLMPSSLSDWLALAGGFMFAANNIQIKRLAHLPGTLSTQAMVTGAFVLCGVTALLLTGTHIIPEPVIDGLKLLGTLALWSVLFLTANLCLQLGASRLPPSTTAILMLSEVLFGAGSAWVLGESGLRWQDMAGGVLIIAASLVRVFLRSRSKARTQDLYNHSNK